MSSATHIIEQAIEQSQQLLLFAEQGDWQDFERLETQRQSGLKQLELANADPAGLTHAQTAELMKKLIDLNLELEKLCQQERSNVAAELKKFNQGHQAKKAYSR